MKKRFVHVTVLEAGDSNCMGPVLVRASPWLHCMPGGVTVGTSKRRKITWRPEWGEGLDLAFIVCFHYWELKPGHSIWQGSISPVSLFFILTQVAQAGFEFTP